MRLITITIFSFILANNLLAQSTLNPGKSLDTISLDDPDLEIKLMQAGALSGDAKWQLEFGLRLLKGKGIARNTREAIIWINKAAEQNDAKAQITLGEIYWKGEDVDQDYSKAYQCYLKAANQGEPLAEYLVGFSYSSGTGIQRDYQKAAGWYLKSAQKGNKLGQHALACCLHNGMGIELNIPQALLWFKKAADQGHTDAQNILAIKHYAKGEYETAKSYSQKSAGSKNAIGQYILSISIMATPGGKDSREAAILMLASAHQGYADAQLSVGEAYLYNGLAGVKNAVEAVKWLKASAEQGDAKAQYLLGGCYATGNGTLKDEIEAYAILNISGINYPKAKIALNLLEDLMSPDARIAGQQRAKQLQAHFEKVRKDKEGSIDTLHQLLKEIEREKSLKGA
jgi:TPR repeat protein